MAFLHATAREIHVNIAYFGPGLAGKTTNLGAIYNSTQPDARSEWSATMDPFPLVCFYIRPPVLPRIGDHQLVFHLSAIPGHVFEDAGRRLLLRHVDAVVFVADAEARRFDANLEMWESLHIFLGEQGRSGVPIVLQYNKADLPSAVTPAELDEVMNHAGLPRLQAVATTGAGVMDTLKAVMKSVLLGLRSGQVTMHDFELLKAPADPLRLWRLFRADLAPG